jgi:serine acetyltransferase
MLYKIIATVDQSFYYAAFNSSFALRLLWKLWIEKVSFYIHLIALLPSWKLQLEITIGTALRERSGIQHGNLCPCAGVSTGPGPTESTTTRTWA